MNEAYVVSRVPRSDAVRWTEDSIIPAEPWVADAGCAQTDPELFHSDRRGFQYHDGKKICHACPSLEPCLNYALEKREEFGLWGGKTPLERLEILRSRRGTP